MFNFVGFPEVMVTAEPEIFPRYIPGYDGADALWKTAGRSHGWNKQYIISLLPICSAALILLSVTT
jgi:hypothetical protein